jgi:hypothetical protein
MATIPEQLAAAVVTDSLKHASLPSSFNKLPWDGATGTWSETEGWVPPAFGAETSGEKTNASGGLYYTPSSLVGGNGFTLVTWNGLSGNLVAERQFSLWLFANTSDFSPDGYQLAAYQNAASATSGKTFLFKLKKWAAGVATTLREGEATMEKGGAFALVKASGKVSIWIKASSAAAFVLLSTELVDASFIEGSSGFDGNGSNPRLANFATGKLVLGTPPTAVTEAATEIHKNDAKISGTSNPGSTSTNVWWEYGTTQAYGFKTAVTNIGAGAAGVKTTLKLEGLQPGTFYHFRFVAESINGRTTATELNFATTGRKVRRRRKPKLGLDVEIETPGGTYRLPADAKNPRNKPRNVTFNTARGEGFSIGTVTLSREIFKDYPDLNLLDTWRFVNQAGKTVYEGRLQAMPRQNDPEEEITINLIGWMTYMKGRKISPLYIDARLTSWEGPSTLRRINLLNANRPAQMEAQVVWGIGGLAIHLEVQNGWTSPTIPICETWFNAGTESVGAVFGDWINGNGNTEFLLQVSFSEFDNAAGGESSGDYYIASTGHISQGPVVPANKHFTFITWQYNATPAGGEGGQYCVDITNLKVVGQRGVALTGTWPNYGPTLSGIMENVIATYYPKLTWAGEANGFVVEQATWHDSPTDGYEVLKQMNNLALWELNCWEERTIHWEPADLTTIDWQFKTTDPGVKTNFEGDSIEDIANGCSVHFTDAAGVPHTLWPNEYEALRDEDPNNPYNQHGENGWTDCDVPYQCSLTEALQFGKVYLEEYNRPKRPGSFTISGGYIKDSAGHWHAGFDVRNGQSCGVMDKMDDEPRLITATQWDDTAKTLTITVDAPEQLIEALIARQELARTVKGVQ